MYYNDYDNSVYNSEIVLVSYDDALDTPYHNCVSILCIVCTVLVIIPPYLRVFR